MGHEFATFRSLLELQHIVACQAQCSKHYSNLRCKFFLLEVRRIQIHFIARVVHVDYVVRLVHLSTVLGPSLDAASDVHQPPVLMT